MEKVSDTKVIEIRLEKSNEENTFQSPPHSALPPPVLLHQDTSPFHTEVIPSIELDEPSPTTTISLKVQPIQPEVPEDKNQSGLKEFVKSIYLDEVIEYLKVHEPKKERQKMNITDRRTVRMPRASQIASIEEDKIYLRKSVRSELDSIKKSYKEKKPRKDSDEVLGDFNNNLHTKILQLIKSIEGFDNEQMQKVLTFANGLVKAPIPSSN
ncbi:hypothetical protein EIN_475760 [Entamoeba invadens IP1]|uniref:Uncharacterized protein n=1 Tax=Entamoeba invadens IP1 TaxID=370355 RepID=A0A0A1U3S4_ENTIV|nr:hypothetical protein EIN_475760 [Entamoeba invadens IP1]ELP88874.1 hypothetical protein EIN_475760 [Entamoeba invadens IP1]|eukprot:XP_004255645.1 hypothetical protein EIN_475760 [Entamoeba invadens IP1]